MPGRAGSGGRACPGRKAGGPRMSVPVPFPTLELFQSQQGLWARLAAGLVCERPRREALFPWGAEGQVWGSCLNPISVLPIGILSTLPLHTCLPDSPGQAEEGVPISIYDTGHSLTSAPSSLRRHSRDSLRVCYYCSRRQPRGHAGLFHGRAPAVWLPGTPWASTT